MRRIAFPPKAIYRKEFTRLAGLFIDIPHPLLQLLEFAVIIFSDFRSQEKLALFQ
jgi:hypothetical protein